VAYAVAVAQPGDYQLRARIAGPPGEPATAEFLPIGGGNALKSFTLSPATEASWVFAGSSHLDPGAYTAQFLLPAGCTLSQVEIAPPCVNGIEPPGGWQPSAIATTQDVAVTAIKAIDVEHELPPAATPIEIAGDQLQVEAPPSAVEDRAKATGLDAMSLHAGRGGLRAIVAFELPDTGLYSISGFVSAGSGQRWLADGCRKAIICPGQTSGWRPILSQVFAAGRHNLVLTLGEGAVFERLRIEKKKSQPADYVAVLKRLGFDAGPDGPVARARALDAVAFIREQRRTLIASMCGDRVPFEEIPTALPTQVAGSGTTPGGGGGSGTGGGGGTGGGTGGQGGSVPQPPVGPPVLPPQELASGTNPGD
jgi:hypothetical protein